MRKLLACWFLAWAAFGIPWTSFTSTAHWEQPHSSPFSGHRLLDDVMNFAFYVPLGAVGQAQGISFGLVTAAGAALSIFTEGTQVFSTERFPTKTDVVMNVSGSMAGYGIVAALKALRGR